MSTICYVICCNDSVEACTTNKSLAKNWLEVLATEHYLRYKVNFPPMTYEEYRKRLYWHMHETPFKEKL